MRTRFFGVDFSGAVDAGRRIWVTELAGGGERLIVLSCRPGLSLPQSGISGDLVYPALVDLIAASQGAAFGLDFPFSLPASLIQAESWAAFAAGFGRRFPTAQDFAAECARLGGGRELRRPTDTEAKVPWAAYNLRLYRQTFHGVRDVLAPLVARDAARVCPMQPADNGLPVLLEICPASLLKKAGIYRSHSGYKARDAEAIRARLLDEVAERWSVDVPAGIRATVIANAGGDALDSLIAALNTAHVIRRGMPLAASDPMQALEGMVYV